MDGSQNETDWTIAGYYGRIRSSGLKPSSIPTVYLDEDNQPWYVQDPSKMTDMEREESFRRLQALRGR